MLDDYRMKGPSKKIELEFEVDVHEALVAMAQHMKFTPSEIANTALRRFISQHKDFLPPGYKYQAD